MSAWSVIDEEGLGSGTGVWIDRRIVLPVLQVYLFLCATCLKSHGTRRKV